MSSVGRQHIVSYGEVSGERSLTSASRDLYDNRCVPVGTTYKGYARLHSEHANGCDPMLYSGRDANGCCEQINYAAMYNLVTAWQIMRDITGISIVEQNDVHRIFLFLRALFLHDFIMYDVMSVTPQDDVNGQRYPITARFFPDMPALQILLHPGSLGRTLYLTGHDETNCDDLLCRVFARLPAEPEQELPFHPVQTVTVQVGRSYIQNPNVNIFSTLSYFRRVIYFVNNRLNFNIPAAPEAHATTEITVRLYNASSYTLDPRQWCNDLKIRANEQAVVIQWSIEHPDADAFLVAWIQHVMDRFIAAGPAVNGSVTMHVRFWRNDQCVFNAVNIQAALQDVVEHFDMEVDDDIIVGVPAEQNMRFGATIDLPERFFRLSIHQGVANMFDVAEDDEQMVDDIRLSLQQLA